MEKRKGERISYSKLVADINEERGTIISERTVRDRVNMDFCHTPPKKGGTERAKEQLHQWKLRLFYQTHYQHIFNSVLQR